MKIQNMNLNKAIFFIRLRIHLFISLISLISLVFIFLRIINFNIISGLSQILFLDWFFHFFVYLSTSFALLFLPVYPIIYVILKDKKLNFLERLAITIITNLSFYIIIGTIGFYTGFALTKWFFFLILVIFYVLILLWILFVDLKKGKYNFFKLNLTPDYKNKFIDNFVNY